MLVTPTPGANRSNVLDALRHVHNTAINTRGATGDSVRRWEQYLRWASDGAQMLRGQVRPTDIDRLVLTPRYYVLQTVSNAVAMDSLLRLELDERVAALEEVVQWFQQQGNRWSPLAKLGHFVVADTSVYIQHPDKLEEVNFAAILALGDEPIHLLVPIAVVDELDRLKQSKGSHARWRASYTLAVIDRVLPRPNEIGVLQEQHRGAHGAPRGGITVELLLDPAGHARLPIVDDEIVDRALAVQSMASGPTSFLTCDTGQSMRARAAGLRVEKIPPPPQDEASS